MYQKTRIHFSREHLVHDLVKRHFHGNEIICVETQKKVCGREFSGYCDGFPPEVGNLFSSYHYGSVTFPHAGSAGEDTVTVLHAQVSVGGDCSDFELRFHGSFVKGLYVFNYVLKVDFLGSYLSARYGVEHERVVGVGTVAQFHEPFFHFRLPVGFVCDGSA